MAIVLIAEPIGVYSGCTLYGSQQRKKFVHKSYSSCVFYATVDETLNLPFKPKSTIQTSQIGVCSCSRSIIELMLYNVGPRDLFSNSKYGCDIYESQLVVGAVQEAITQAKEENMRLSSTKTIGAFSHFSNLPVEVAISITEIVCPVKYTLNDVHGISKILLAFR